jgi:hypothetical protein
MKKISILSILMLTIQVSMAQSITLDPSLNAANGVVVNSDLAFSNALRIKNFGTYASLSPGNANVLVFEDGGVLEGIRNVANGTLLLIYNGLGNEDPNAKNLTIKHLAHTTGLSFYQIVTPNAADYVLNKSNAGVLLIYLTAIGKWKIIDTEVYKKPSFSNEWMTQRNLFQQNTTDFLGTTDNQALAFRTNNTEQMRITADGKVGIGTSTPKTKLDVNGNVSFASKEITSSQTLVYNSLDRSLLSRIKFNTNNLADITVNGINQAIDGTILFISTGVFTTLIFNNVSTSAIASERIFTPSGHPLTLPPNSGATLIHVAGHWQLFGTHSNGNRNTKSWSKIGNFANDADSAHVGTRDNQALSIKTDSIERMRINAAGDFRIGVTTTTNKPFSVTGGNFNFDSSLIPEMKASFEDNQSHHIGINSANNKNSTLLLDYKTVITPGIIINFPYNKIAYTETNNLRLGSFTNAGITVSEFNVGINTNSPKAKLDVDGPLKVAVKTVFEIFGPNAESSTISELDIENKSFFQFEKAFGLGGLTFTINGIKPPEAGINGIGTMLFFANKAAAQYGHTIILRNNAGTNANRIITADGADLVLTPDRNAVMIYDYDGWKVIAK